MKHLTRVKDGGFVLTSGLRVWSAVSGGREQKEGAAVGCGGRNVRLLSHTGACQEAERRIRVLKMVLSRHVKNCVGNLMGTALEL